jgi:hypothetical protein
MPDFRMSHWLLLLVAIVVSGPLVTVALGRASIAGDWRTATHRPSGLAPDPAAFHDAVVQVYAGRAFGWRGAFADHTWLAVKPAGAARYTRYEVIGWLARAGGSALSVSSARAPDAEWFGSTPRLLRDLRGAEAEAAIAKLDRAVADYPYARSYSAWPGPNSNTFVAHVGRALPELRLALPSTAIGKDYFPLAEAVSRTPSGTGYQLSLLGLLGVSVALDEGFELNLLGLVFGFDVRSPAVKLPGIGRVPQ